MDTTSTASPRQLDDDLPSASTPTPSTPPPSAPVVLDAASIRALPLTSFGELEGVRHRVLWADEGSMAGVMTVDAGHRLGRHTHAGHHHHVWILEGSARVLGEDLGPGSYVHIPHGVEHDIDATGSDGCTFLYQYLDQCSTEREGSR